MKLDGILAVFSEEDNLQVTTKPRHAATLHFGANQNKIGHYFTLLQVEIPGGLQGNPLLRSRNSLKVRASMEGPKDSKLYLFIFFNKVNSKTKFTSLPLPELVSSSHTKAHKTEVSNQEK